MAEGELRLDPREEPAPGGVAGDLRGGVAGRSGESSAGPSGAVAPETPGPETGGVPGSSRPLDGSLLIVPPLRRRRRQRPPRPPGEPGALAGALQGRFLVPVRAGLGRAVRVAGAAGERAGEFLRGLRSQAGRAARRVPPGDESPPTGVVSGESVPVAGDGPRMTGEEASAKAPREAPPAGPAMPASPATPASRPAAPSVSSSSPDVAAVPRDAEAGPDPASFGWLLLAVIYLLTATYTAQPAPGEGLFGAAIAGGDRMAAWLVVVPYLFAGVYTGLTRDGRGWLYPLSFAFWPLAIERGLLYLFGLGGQWMMAGFPDGWQEAAGLETALAFTRETLAPFATTTYVALAPASLALTAAVSWATHRLTAGLRGHAGRHTQDPARGGHGMSRLRGRLQGSMLRRAPHA